MITFPTLSAHLNEFYQYLNYLKIVIPHAFRTSILSQVLYLLIRSGDCHFKQAWIHNPKALKRSLVSLAKGPGKTETLKTIYLYPSQTLQKNCGPIPTHTSPAKGEAKASTLLWLE